MVRRSGGRLAPARKLTFGETSNSTAGGAVTDDRGWPRVPDLALVGSTPWNHFFIPTDFDLTLRFVLGMCLNLQRLDLYAMQAS